MKQLFLLLLFLFAVAKAGAQEFMSGQQAKGYMNEKNTSVDHATGIFHYRIPIYTFHSGSYELPITLDYTATGVRENDLPGMLGYNWSLNVGGIVARTTRGMNDESGGAPYVAYPDQRLVSMGYYDGESDIFTAVFNGKSVNFIVSKEWSSKKLVAIPLERTSAQIDYEVNGGNGGWIVTDDDGTRYCYREAEWRTKVLKATAVSQETDTLKSHVSAWHLSRIEPVNAAPIEFVYEGQVGPMSRVNAAVHVEEILNELRYSYGRPMVEYKLGQSQYMMNFENHLEQAKRAFNMLGLEAQTKNPKYLFSTYGIWELNPTYEIGITINKQCQRIIGQLADFSQPLGAYSEISSILSSYIDDCRRIGSSSSIRAAGHLEDAQKALCRAMYDKIENMGSSTTNIIGCTVHAPILNRICCNNYEIKFDNGSWSNGQTKLNSIDLHTLSGSTRLLTPVINNFQTLASVSLCDGNKFNFRYYSGKYTIDHWGYLASSTGEGSGLSLKTVTSTYGGTMTLAYEQNIVSRIPNLSAEVGSSHNMGGIRISHIISQEPCSQRADTIFYSYPYLGSAVHEDWFISESLDYGSFKDEVYFSQMQHRGPSYVRTGNNGVYYPYVIEYTRGKGAQAYLFNIPTRKKGGPKTPYAFWLYGLPLATASYDNNHHLKRLIRNTYYTDLSFDDYTLGLMLGDNADYFVDGDPSCKYASSSEQVAAYGLYMDYSKIERIYREMDVIPLCNLKVMDPYKDIYENNFGVRTQINVPDLSYNLVYGGATLMKEQTEYLYEEADSGIISYSDFSRIQDIPYRKAEYFYENVANSLLPTRVDETTSGNELLSTRFWRCAEMRVPGDTILSEMQRYHLLSPVIKKQVVGNGKLIEEQVYKYHFTRKATNFTPAWEIEPASCIELSGEYLYVPSNPSTPPSDRAMAASSLFTFGAENYSTLGDNVYKKINHAYLPVESRSRKELQTTVYNTGGTTSILQAKQVESRFVTAKDRKYALDIKAVANAQDSSRYCANVMRHFISEHYLDFQRLMTMFSKGTIGRLALFFDMHSTPVATKYSDGEVYDLCDILISATDLPQAIRFFPIYIRLTPDEKEDYDRMIQAIFNYDGYTALPNIKRWSWIEEVMPDKAVEVTDFPTSGKMKVYLLVEGGSSVSADCVLTHAGGETCIPFPCAAFTGYVLKTFDIDLTSYQSISSLKTGKEEGVAYIAIVPDGTIFEAKSYNPDGTLFAQFDQTCLMKVYEYDDFKRVVKVSDGNGNVLEEYSYSNVP